MKNVLTLILFILFCINSYAQQGITDKELKRATIESFEVLKELLAIPNDANHPEDIEKNIVWVESHMSDLGFTSQRLETETVPLLLANYKTKKPDKSKGIRTYIPIAQWSLWELCPESSIEIS